MTSRKSKRVKNAEIWELKRAIAEIIAHKKEIYASFKEDLDAVEEYERSKLSQQLDNYDNGRFEGFHMQFDWLWSSVKEAANDLYRLAIRMTDLCHKITFALNERLGLENNKEAKEYDSRIWAELGMEHGPASDEFLQMKQHELSNFIQKSKATIANRKPGEPKELVDYMEKRRRLIEIVDPFWIDSAVKNCKYSK